MALDSTSAPRRPLAEPTLSDNGFKAMSADEKTARVAEFRNESPEKQALWLRVFQTRRDGVFEISPDGTEKKLEKTEMKEYLDWFGLTRKYGNPPGFKGTVVLDTTSSAAVAAPASGPAAATPAPAAKGPDVPNPGKKKRMDSPAPAAAPAPRSSPVAAPAAAPKAKPDASPAAPAAAPKAPDPIVIPAMPAAVVIPPAPTGDASTMTGDQLAAFNAQMEARSSAMQRRVVELEGLLRQVQAAQAAGTAVPEQYAGVLAERDALRRIHGLGDADASRVLQIAHEKFAPQAIPADATPEQRERIERSNALSAKTLRTLEKRRYELRVKAEKIPTDAGKGAILDALRNHLALPWWKRFGSSAAITGIGALTGYGAMSALTTYAGLGTLAFLGSLAGAPLLTGGAIVGGTFAHLYKRFHHQNAIGQGRSALLHKSPTTSAAVLSLLIGGAKFAAWNTAAGQTIIGALGGKLSQLTHGAFDSILHMFSSGPRPRMPIGKGPTLRL